MKKKLLLLVGVVAVLGVVAVFAMKFLKKKKNDEAALEEYLDCSID